jgi:Bacterial regulatory proteins, gntR family
MSILFRTKGWLTVAQLARAWTPEIPGAAQNPQQFEQDLGHLLLEDIVNNRLDDVGPLAEGRRLGLRVVTPEARAGFLEGHQVRDLVSAGGELTFFLHRIVVMKEAALDFARRHELPPPSWWTGASAASPMPANHLASDGTIPIPKAASKSPADAGSKRRRGRRPEKFERAKEAMKNDIRTGPLTVADLNKMLEKDLAAEYGVSRDTARKARKAVLVVENSILDK